MELYFVFIILFIFSIKRGLSVSSVLCGIYLTSLTGMFLLSPSYFFEFNLGLFEFIFLSLFFSLIILPWKCLKMSRPIDLVMTSGDYRFYRMYKRLGFICLVVNITIFIALHNVVMDYSAFKNGGESLDYVNYIPLPHILTLLISWFSRSYLFMLPFHFWFLKKGNLRESVISLVLSGNYVLIGLAGFSRSSTASFVIIYFLLLLYFYRTIDKFTLFSYSKYLLISLIGFSSVFYAITMNRFSSGNEFVNYAFMHHDGLIDNPVLNSQVSYLSQWYENTVKWLPRYPDTTLTYGVRSLPLLFFLLEKLELTNGKGSLVIELGRQFGDSDMGSFMGVATNLIFDIGYVGSIIFAIVYFIIVNQNSRRRYRRIIDFFPVVILIQIPATGIFNSCMNTMEWHLCILLYLIFYKYYFCKRG